jgi:hypothetical protein
MVKIYAQAERWRQEDEGGKMDSLFIFLPPFFRLPPCCFCRSPELARAVNGENLCAGGKMATGR